MRDLHLDRAVAPNLFDVAATPNWFFRWSSPTSCRRAFGSCAIIWRVCRTEHVQGLRSNHQY
jgi:hypothetical protein